MKLIYGDRFKINVLALFFVFVILSAILLFIILQRVKKENSIDLASLNQGFKIDIAEIEKTKGLEDIFEVRDVIRFEGQVIGSIEKFIILPSGDFLIKDGVSKDIYIFGQHGKFLRSIGAKGSGPGEFLNPVDVKFNPKDKLIYVLDIKLSRIIAFDTLGKYQFSFNIKRRGEHMILSPDGGRIYVYSTGYVSEDMVSCYDTSGKILFTFCKPSDFIKKIKIPITGVVGGIVLENGKIFLMHPYEHVIRIFTPDGRNIENISLNSDLYKYPQISGNLLLDIKSFTPILSPVLNFDGVFFIILQVPDERGAKNYLEIVYLPERRVLNSVYLSDMYPLYVDNYGYVYFCYQPKPVESNLLSNPVVYKCKFSPLKLKVKG